MFHGNKEARSIMKDHEWTFRDSKGKVVSGVYKYNMMITSYDLVKNENAFLRSVNWEVIVLDEGHRIKKIDGVTSEKLRAVPADHKVILTGTPLQNNTHELWVLMNFLDPSTFNSSAEFAKQFGDIQERRSPEQVFVFLMFE